MDLALFSTSSSGRLVEAGQGEAAYWAFVPGVLPPDLAYDHELVLVLSEADRALAELAGLGRMLPNPHLLVRPFIHREAVLSSRIEGTQADVAELYRFEAEQLALPGLRPDPSQADVREVANYVRALEYGLERLETLPLSRRFMREIHEHLMEGVRGGQATPGEFRRSQNWIGVPGSTLSTATYVPPPVSEMEIALTALENYLHADDRYPPLVRIAFLHYQFEAIHPFIDGNGRVGRLLISLLLVHWNLLPFPLLYLSAFFERHRGRYIGLLFAVSARSAWREWVMFFLEGVAEQARDAVNRAKRLQDLQQTWRDRFTHERASNSVLLLLESLFVSPFVTIPLVQRELDISYPTAQRAVDRLVHAGVLRQIGEVAYGRWYVAEDILRAIGE